ncbi:MAG: acyl carrier protein [Rhodobacter sp.]|nr:acyl carrier protein [Rhodobacter sp.]
MDDGQLTLNKDIANFVETAWRELFGATAIRPSDSFFDLGGTSMAAVKFITAIEREFGLDALSPEELYEDPAFGSIVSVIGKNASL